MADLGHGLTSESWAVAGQPKVTHWRPVAVPPGLHKAQPSSGRTAPSLYGDLGQTTRSTAPAAPCGLAGPPGLCVHTGWVGSYPRRPALLESAFCPRFLASLISRGARQGACRI